MPGRAQRSLLGLCAQVASRAAFVRVSWWGGGTTCAWPDRALLSQCAPDSCDGAKLAAGLCAQLVRQYSDCYDARHPTGKTTRRASPAISCTLSTMTYVCTFPGATHRCTCPLFASQSGSVSLPRPSLLSCLSPLCLPCLRSFCHRNASSAEACDCKTLRCSSRGAALTQVAVC